MKKVCHLSSVHTTFDTRIFHKECVSLTKEYEVHLVIPAEKDEVVNNVSIHHIDNAKTSRLKRMTARVWQVYKKAKEVDAELYHFHDPELIPVGLLLKCTGKKVIYDIHEDVPKQIMSKEWIPILLRKFVSCGMSLGEFICDKIFDGIVTVVPEIEIRFNNKNTVCLYNYPILEEYTERNMIDDNKFTFGYVGGLTEIRGIYEMVDAAKKSGLNVKLAGKCENDKISRLVEQCEIKNLNYLGFLNRKEVLDFYKSIDCGLVVLHPEPNYLISQPVKMKEYMEAGIPFIASDFPVWREFIDKYKCGIYINPLDVNAIIKAMQWIINNQQKALEMGRNGRKAIEKEFNWAIEEKKLLKLYREVLS